MRPTPMPVFDGTKIQVPFVYEKKPMSLNPLDDLLDGTFTSPVPRLHSSGRREQRAQMHARGITIHAKAKTSADAERAMLTGEMIATLPIKRKEPKRPEGMSARQWRKYRRGTVG